MQTLPRGESIVRFVAGDQRTERCACGGWLVADPLSDRDVLAAVQRHNATLLHQWWRRESGL